MIKSLETKVVILGHSGVGKTSLVNQYVRGQFTGNMTATIGAAFTKKPVVVNDWTVNLCIWDTAGQERFRSMAPMYYRGAQAAILVFDVSQSTSFEKVQSWVEELKDNASEDIILVLAANKSDLRKERPDVCIALDQAAAYAKTIGAVMFETSAKTGKGIEELFQNIARLILKRHATAHQQQQSRLAESARAGSSLGGSGGSDHVQLTASKPPSSGGCC